MTVYVGSQWNATILPYCAAAATLAEEIQREKIPQPQTMRTPPRRKTEKSNDYTQDDASVNEEVYI